MNTNNYIEELAKLTATGSDYAVAKLLEISEDAIRGWRKRGSIPDAATCFKIADILHIEREEVLINVNLAGAKKPSDRKVWTQLAGKAASVVSGICLLYLLNSGDSWASDQQKMWLKTSSMEQKNAGIKEANNETCYKLYASWQRLKTQMRRFWDTVAARMTLTGYAA